MSWSQILDLRAYLCLILVSTLIGCSGDGGFEAIPESGEKQFQRAQRYLREGRESEALNAFLRVIERRSDAAESHLEAGRLFARHVGDPIAAIYHYRRYLELNPQSQHADQVRQLIETAQKDFARQLPGQPFRHEIDRLDLLAIVEDARAENLALKQRLAETERRLARYEGTTVRAPTERTAPRTTTPSPSPGTTSGGQTQTPATPRTYVVQEGDTLSSISVKVYGTPRRFADIFEANRDTLASPNSLRIGQTLRIPQD